MYNLVVRLEQRRSKCSRKTGTIEEKMMQSLFTVFADEANGTISDSSPGYTSIHTKITRKSNLPMETTDKVRVITKS